MAILGKNCRWSIAGLLITAFRVKKRISSRKPCRRLLLQGSSLMPTIVEDPRRVSPPPPVIPANDGGDGDFGDHGSSFPLTKGQIGTWILLTAIIMLFAGLSSAYIVLRGVPSWQNIELPFLLWPNTAILLLSSLAVEISKRAIRRNDVESMRRWLVVAGVLGFGFL